MFILTMHIYNRNVFKTLRIVLKFFIFQWRNVVNFLLVTCDTQAKFQATHKIRSN